MGYSNRDYMAGVYDIPCEYCLGRSTVQEVDREACDPELLKAYDEQEEQDRRYERERYFEIMAGC